MPSQDIPAELAGGAGVTIRTSTELGELVKAVRRSQGLLQADLAGLSGTGNRYVVDLERGKPTLQLQKVLDMLDLLGLEVQVAPKRPRLP
ncbi:MULTISPECIES: helix-turn-helix domain-containing protein [Achromobacter]|uniref:Helix-turn-helix domain-containing protein n=1 Tax=Achromobacter aegrifaciens TaxID=1287736 RepID=A0ABU2DG55_ACHAE|nr:MULTISPECIES: helix-turn-helix domain-containing protein [Achromobacter]PTN49064.1 transcriptional regulator [Achromobacter xylosoxidans]MBD9382738.1 helix-turn-helix transcriptional regulator [Achromobacter sp. ACM02]MBD9420704.1 helix-turn-helix transcriptional regulator [Achromobacter sp. ACM04]MBD9471968.1 helix-turn-helix transcriptional regulator [Achromobacter sp. ACM01]MDQ1760781.1 helix-turn-helix domain-containing protein [Achromobacter aegrifaciens]